LRKRHRRVLVAQGTGYRSQKSQFRPPPENASIAARGRSMGRIMDRTTPRRLLALLLVAAGVLAAVPGPVRAQEQGRSEDRGQARGAERGQGPGLLSLLPDPAGGRRVASFDGKPFAYRVEAGPLPLREGTTGAVSAAIFSVAYLADPPDPKRPITFVFNGGPGAASAYLHLGGLGPKVVATADNGDMLPPPARLVDNPDSWLAFTDLVFVDPVGTGYSRAADPSKESDFYGVDQDATVMAAFVRLYLQGKGRRLSPVYLAGESYGGFRVALLARRLQGESGVTPSGVVMISPALEFSLLDAETYDPLPWALGLPAMAAVRLAGEGVTGRDALAARLKPVEDYALGPYLADLASGLAEGGRRAGAEVARLTGLPQAVVDRNFARIPASVFIKEARRDRGEVASRYDGTIGAPDPSPQSSRPGGPDPVLDRVGAVLASALVAYVRDDIGFRTDITYRVLNGEVNRRWDFGTSPSRQGYAGALGDLEEARSLAPSMRILIAQGYTDLTTPYLAARYLVGQAAPLAGAVPIEVETYEGGHMMYLRPDSRHALAADVAKLFGRE
jgi:carboxypeptidase C (cathepsin A)